MSPYLAQLNGLPQPRSFGTLHVRRAETSQKNTRQNNAGARSRTRPNNATHHHEFGPLLRPTTIGTNMPSVLFLQGAGRGYLLRHPCSGETCPSADMCLCMCMCTCTEVSALPPSHIYGCAHPRTVRTLTAVHELVGLDIRDSRRGTWRWAGLSL